MRKYYLFIIRNKKFQKPKEIYHVLEELFYLNSNKFKYGIKIFEELCEYFNKEKFLYCLKEKFETRNNKILVNDIESALVEVTNTCIVIKTNKNVSNLFKYLNEINSNILICDFINKDYFWLNDFVKLNLKIVI